MQRIERRATTSPIGFRDAGFLQPSKSGVLYKKGSYKS